MQSITIIQIQLYTQVLRSLLMIELNFMQEMFPHQIKTPQKVWCSNQWFIWKMFSQLSYLNLVQKCATVKAKTFACFSQAKSNHLLAFNWLDDCLIATDVLMISRSRCHLLNANVIWYTKLTPNNISHDVATGLDLFEKLIIQRCRLFTVHSKLNLIFARKKPV